MFIQDARTRERVLQAVSTDGPVTAAALSERFGLTTAAVRRHLDALAEQGAIVDHAPPVPAGKRGRGRPARAWVMAEKGHTALNNDYNDLAGQALRFISETGGPDAITRFAQERIAALEAEYAVQLESAGNDPVSRAHALAEVLSKDGFAATARPVGAGALAGVQLCQGHCPVQHVAAEFPQLCDAEAEAFSRLIGVRVQRLATLAAGDHVCTTFLALNEVGQIADAAAAAGAESARAGIPAHVESAHTAPGDPPRTTPWTTSRTERQH